MDGIDAGLRLSLAGCLSAARIAHSERVASLAAELCGRFGVAPDKGRTAGLGHDIAREMDIAAVRQTAAQDGSPFDADEMDMPILAHGRAGAVLLTSLGVRDPDVLQAVRDHVTGRAGMGALSAVVFAADYLEPGRGFLAERDREAALALGLWDMVGTVLERTVAYLEGTGMAVARASRDLDRWLRQERVHGG